MQITRSIFSKAPIRDISKERGNKGVVGEKSRKKRKMFAQRVTNVAAKN